MSIMKQQYFVWLLSFVCCAIRLNAQPAHLEFPPGRYPVVSLDVRIANNLMLLPLTINTSDTLQMILDTGVKTAVITEIRPSDSLNLSDEGNVIIRGLGQGEGVQALRSQDNTFVLDKLRADSFTVHLIKENYFMLSNKLGVRVNGLIGYDLFHNTLVMFQFSNHMVHIAPQGSKKLKPGRKYHAVPFELIDSKPYVKVVVYYTATDSSELNLLVDTGSSDAVWLFEQPNRLPPTTPVLRQNFLGQGLSGPVYGAKARIHALQLGDFCIQGPIVAFPDSGFVAHLADADTRHGSIGSEFFYRFDILFDYTNRTMWLKPNRFFDAGFTYNRSGIELTAPLPGVRLYEISHVSAGSVAWEQGMRSGDILVKVNGTRASEAEMYELSALLGSANRLRIAIMRGGQLMNFSFDNPEIL